MSNSSEAATQPSDFLGRVLPSEGLKVVAIKRAGEAPRHVFCQTVEEAAHAIGRASAAGFDAYHACASYRAQGSRKGDNVLAVQAFWLDVDAGEGKPYADVVDAWDAVADFVRRHRLPDPLVVVSGLGLHLYWTLDRPLDPAAWQAGARRLRTLVDLGGLKVDQSRTADIASILRPPGSLNYKYDPPRPVTVAQWGTPCPADEFLALLGPQLSPEMQAHADRLASAAKPDYSGPKQPTYGALIVDQCAQLRALRDSGGRIPEPEWYASLCLLAHCDDGDDLAHRWSSGDERYSPEATQAKLEHARRDSGPMTCAGFAARNAARCIGCPHQGKIVSPISLGRTQTPLPPLPEMSVPGQENVVAGVVVPPCPWPYFRGLGQNISTKQDNENGTARTVIIYEHPAFVSAVRRGESDQDVSIVLKHFLPHEGWAEAVIPWQDHSPNAVLNAIGNQLVIVNLDCRQKMMDYIYRAAKQILAARKTDVEYSQFGWKSDLSGFLWGKYYYGADADEPIEVGVSAEAIDRANMMGKKGTYEAWRSAANQMFAGPQQGLLLLASFAAPLMRFRTSAGGAIISAVSRQSGRGKTLALTSAKSVWGSKQALDMNRVDTNNSRIRALAVLGNLPVIFDELRNRDLEVVKDFVLSFTDGRDKNRLTAEGRLRALSGGWSTLLLSASNLSLAQMVSYDGENAQMARVLEYQMELPGGLSPSDGAYLERTFDNNYGWAGDDYVFNITQKETLGWIAQNIDKRAREVEKLMPGTANRLYVSALACIHTAGELVKQFGILEFSLDKIMEFGIRAGLSMSNQLGSMEIRSTDILGQFVNEHWTQCLCVEEAFGPGRSSAVLQAPRDKLVMRYERITRRLYIDRRVLREWCTLRRYNFAELEDDLYSSRIALSIADNKNLGAGTHYNAAGALRVWQVDATAIQPVEDFDRALPPPGQSPVPIPSAKEIAALRSTSAGNGSRPPGQPG